MFKTRRRRELEILASDERAKMREVGLLAAELVGKLGAMVEPGLSTAELDDVAVRFAKEHGVQNAPLDYKGFPRSICTSINEVVCHGIPSEDEVMQDGDLISIDVTLIKDGFHGDTCATFFVGEPSDEARELVQVTAECLVRGMEQVRPGNRIGDIGYAIQRWAEEREYAVVREFQGHGIGRKFHTAPDVPHFGKRGKGMRLRPGMSFTIEPMINAGDWPTKVLDDGWTAITRDNSLSAQFEHTIVVTDDGFEAMTAPEGVDPLKVSPGGVIEID
jgi:methionyl aminopeptidase